MKSIRSFLIGLVISGSLAASLHFLHAQESATSTLSQQAVNAMSDTEVMLQAVESVPPAPASTAPRFSTFYSAMHAPGTRHPWPPLPGNSQQLPVWNLGDGIYLLDDLQLMSSGMAGGMMAPDDYGLPGGGTNGGSPSLLIPPVYTTNDLWLQMIGKTNTTAYLTIHPPWTVTNGVYDLYYTTNLTAPATWSWVLRSFAGVTNLAVNNATDAQGFYRLGPQNDPVGNDSSGTNFWFAFFAMWYRDAPDTSLTLYISSPASASGTVTIPGLGITNAFTVTAGGVTSMSITNGAMMDLDSYDAIQSKGFHVVATQPVSVYAMNYTKQGLSAAFTCYPTNLLGTNYCLMARPAYCEADSELALWQQQITPR